MGGVSVGGEQELDLERMPELYQQIPLKLVTAVKHAGLRQFVCLFFHEN
jgi:hypothetical protein